MPGDHVAEPEAGEAGELVAPALDRVGAPAVAPRGVIARANPVAKLAVASAVALALVLTVDVVTAGVALLLEVFALPWCGIPPSMLLRRGWRLALLQTASNPYVSLIGPIESAASRISIMGICNKVAGILAGLIFGYIALKDADKFEASLKTMDDVAKNARLDELAVLERQRLGVIEQLQTRDAIADDEDRAHLVGRGLELPGHRVERAAALLVDVGHRARP